jgi:ribosome-associated protein
MDILEIMDGVAVPLAELRLTAARASGPGGQHVNTTASKVVLHFDVMGSPSLTGLQKTIIRAKLHRRMTKKGVLVLAAEGERSQKANRDAVVERLRRMLARALKPVLPRIPTRTPKAQKRRRVDAKKHRGRVKSKRDRSRLWDDT